MVFYVYKYDYICFLSFASSAFVIFRELSVTSNLAKELCKWKIAILLLNIFDCL